MLFVVSTPIGNLEDISLRAIRILKEVDFVACEDTRHSGLLLQKLEISSKNAEGKSRLISFHSHSAKGKTEKILELLREGKNVALISDAGTPGISDPAFELTSVARENGIEISPVPGASAFLSALQASGLPANTFTYLGFAPAKKGRETFFKSLESFGQSVVFYESVHRIEKCLSQMLELLGDRRVVVAREITKKFEEFFDGNLEEAVKHFKNPKGEFVVILPRENF